MPRIGVPDQPRETDRTAIAAASSRPLETRTVLGALAAAAVIVGSLGPWASVGFFSGGGMGGGDAWITLAAGVLGLVWVLARWTPILTGLAGAVAGGVGAEDWHDVTQAEVLGIALSVEWGLVLVTLGGAALLLWSLAPWLGWDAS